VGNDVWNPGSGWEQQLQVNDQTGAFTVTKSNANNLTTPASYPSIIRGNSWGTATTNSGLPMQVSGLNVDTSWNISTVNSGVWDAAYDIWFDKASDYMGGQPSGPELMIWINYNAKEWAQKKVGTVSLAGATWDVYYWMANFSFGSWNYIAYVRSTNTTYVSFNLNTFVKDAVSRGYIQNSWYLVAVDAGFELWQGGVGLTSNSFSVSYPNGTSHPSGIWMDGDMNEWNGIAPVMTDPVGDTENWSKGLGFRGQNGSYNGLWGYPPGVIGKGTTAEPINNATQIKLNDECRDLKALYIYNEPDWICIRLDIAGLYPGFNAVSEHPELNASNPSQIIGYLSYPNVSAYQIYFTVPGSSMQQTGAAWANDLDFVDATPDYWSFSVQFDGYGTPFLQFADWSTAPVTSWAVNITAGAFEFALNRTYIETKLGVTLGKVGVVVCSLKPGEAWGTWGDWMHAFDPQNPGTPGEIWGAGGQATVSYDGYTYPACAGEDYADFMSNANVTYPSGPGWAAQGEYAHVTGWTWVDMAKPPFHSIAVVRISPFASEAYPTWNGPLRINVTVENNGTFTETFTISLYWNSTSVVGTQPVTLAIGQTMNVTFTWTIPTIPFAHPYPIYILSANATVSGNINSGVLIGGSVTVKWPGDCNGDGHVNGYDLFIMAKAWHSNIGNPNYDPRADFNMDGSINGFDLYWMAVNWHRGPLD
jgi:cellulose 1,4-beta-cellobiosidase